MNFYRDTGRNVNGARQPTPSEGKVKHETVLEMRTVGGKNTFETDKITFVLPMLHGGFHSPLLVSLISSEMETVVEQDEHPASHVPHLKSVVFPRIAPLYALLQEDRTRST
jgi:hypothetical protein